MGNLRVFRSINNKWIDLVDFIISLKLYVCMYVCVLAFCWDYAYIFNKQWNHPEFAHTFQCNYLKLIHFMCLCSKFSWSQRNYTPFSSYLLSRIVFTEQFAHTYMQFLSSHNQNIIRLLRLRHWLLVQFSLKWNFVLHSTKIAK